MNSDVKSLAPTLRPPIRWAGSKRALIPTLKSLLPSEYDRYVEPFAGSACLFFAVPPVTALLSDFNADLVQMYSVLRDSCDDLIEAVSLLDSSEKAYYELRALRTVDLGDVDRAARFFYLNRYSFNGVYRTNRKGQFNVPRGSRTGSLPSADELRAVSQRLQYATLLHQDFRVTLADVGKGDLVYVDPPYLTTGRKVYGEYGYGSFGSAEDLADFNTLLTNASDAGAKVLLSFGSADVFSAALEGWDITHLRTKRRVAASLDSRKVSTDEILARNYT